MTQKPKDLFYFDSDMNLQKITVSEETAQSITSELVPFAISCPHCDHRYCKIYLFLKNNPWTHYTRFNSMSHCVTHSAEFYFRDCVVCGKNKFKDNFLSSYLGFFESPISCENPSCINLLEKLRMGSEGEMIFYHKVWTRDIDFLNYYSKVL